MKYKLIKSYPNSRETGTIVSPVPQPDTASKTSRYIDSSGRYYGWHEVEDYPEYWEEVKEPTFKVGEWVVDSRDNGIFRITKIDPIDNRRLFGSSEYEWLHSSYFRLATTQEIETHLIAEAKKRGFAKGVSYRYPDRPDLGIRKVESNEFGYNAEYDSFYDKGFHNHNLYRGGQWAEIVKEEEIKIGGYNTIIEDNMFWVGCRSFSFEKIKELYSIICYFGIESISIRDTKVTSDIVKKVLDKIDRQ